MHWKLYPIYGLTITEPDAWTDDPLFGDATIVSRHALIEHLGPEANPALSHGKLTAQIGYDDLANAGIPTAQLVEIEPASYIAVCSNSSDTSRSIRRAAEVRAFLSATLALRANRIQTLAALPAQIAWFINPGEITIQPSQPVETVVVPNFNEHVLVTPLEVAQADLRRSLQQGTPIPNSKSWHWDISANHPISDLFLRKITKFQKRLLNAALLIQDAGCAVTYETQLQMAVASMEVLLKPESFDELGRTLKAFAQGGEQESRVDSILTTRHRITHEGAGCGDADGNIKVAAKEALHLSWLMLDIATAFCHANKALPFNDYIGMLRLAVELDTKTSFFGNRIASAHQEALRNTVQPFAEFLTSRRRFSVASACPTTIT